MISVFTASHDTRYLSEAYSSLLNQTSPNWNWTLLLNNGAEFNCEDDRVSIHRDTTDITNVGYLKRRACELCTGDILLEFDHDDILTPTAIEEAEKAFSDPSVDFAFSNTVSHDVRTNQPLIYPEQFGWKYKDFQMNGWVSKEAISPAAVPQNLSRIWFAPNHFRAWRREFYWKIGGHSGKMAVSDDHDLVCRSYLGGKMLHIDKPLYFYRVHGGNTWLKNGQEIETAMWQVYDKYIYSMAMKWATERNLRCIDLCGGIACPKGYESVDKYDALISSDLDERWPFEDNSVGFIRAHDAIEHLKNPIHTMNEAWRVLAHGGFFLIQVPSSEGVGADCDPTHVSRWNWRSFRYYTEEKIQKHIKNAGANCRFQKLKVENRMLYDGVLYVIAHLIAIKEGGERFHGELLI